MLRYLSSEAELPRMEDRSMNGQHWPPSTRWVRIMTALTKVVGDVGRF
jgi:hypothetical protein